MLRHKVLNGLCLRRILELFHEAHENERKQIVDEVPPNAPRILYPRIHRKERRRECRRMAANEKNLAVYVREELRENEALLFGKRVPDGSIHVLTRRYKHRLNSLGVLHCCASLSNVDYQ